MALRADDVDIARDRELVTRFQTGELGAFEDLYARYFDRLRRMCVRRVGDAHEAEEIAQEAFARAYVAFPQLGGPRHVYAWLSVVANRLCVDAYRRRARTEPTEHVANSDVAIDDDHLEAEVDLAHLKLALRRITPRHREVLAFREEQGYTYQQIAEHYGVSLGTVEALLFRARQALRREFTAIATGRGGFAALPIIGPAIGLVLRRVAALRERLDPWSHALTPLPYAELTTIVALVTGIGMAFGPGTTGSHRASDTPPAIVRVADVAVDDLAGDATDAVDMASERSAAPPGDRPGTARSPGAALPAPETMDFATAKRNAEQEPTHASTDRVTVGVDADEAVAATATAGGAYADQLQDWTERSRP